MPMKLIGFILFIVIIFAFIGFNLDNHTNINIWVNEKGHFEDVSIIIVVFAAYLFGLVSTVPFWFARSFSRRKSKKSEGGKRKDTPALMNETSDAGGEKEREKKKPLLGGRKNKKKDDES